MHNKSFLYFTLIIATIFVSAVAIAEEGVSDITTDAPAATASDDSSTYVSGGVGEEMAYLQSIQNEYSLKFLITEKNGIFLADVEAVITDSKGNSVLDTVTQGPVLLVKLPPGKYKAKFTLDNVVREQKVVVKANMLNAYLISFPEENERMSGLPKTTPLK